MTHSTLTATARQDRMPMAALLALAMTGFICIVTETLPAGLLHPMATGLNTSTSLAGQTVSVYALGSLMAAIPLTLATQGWPRRKVLLAAIVGFLMFNSITAVSSFYWLTLVARFLAGVSAGLAWSLLAGYARRMVAPHQQGKAMAVAMVGTPVALSLGVPLGTWLGTVIGWRSAFAALSALTVVLIVWVLAKVPDYPGQRQQAHLNLRQVFITPGVRAVLGVVVLWMLAHNILYTYIASFIEPAGLTSRVDVVLLVFGVAALVAIVLTGRLVDRYLRITVLASLAVFAMASLLFMSAAQLPAVIYVGVMLWGLTFGGAATLLQTALADTAGEGADVAQSMNVVAWNSAIAGGGVVGGMLLDGWGVTAFPPVVLVLLMAALLLSWHARTHGFRAGPRHAHHGH